MPEEAPGSSGAASRRRRQRHRELLGGAVGAMTAVIFGLSVLLRVGVIEPAFVIRLHNAVLSPHPDTWDSRVAPLVSFVEQDRGLRFEHPVHVEFLSEADFRAEVTVGEDAGDAEREAAEDELAPLRAGGLIGEDVDAVNANDELQGGNVLGFYRFDRKRIVVRGSELTTAVRATLVHELVHALQDQHFDVGRRMPDGGSAEMAYRAVLEADAGRTEDAWVDSLGVEERRDYQGDVGDPDGTPRLDGVPDVLVDLLAAPYVLGPMFLDDVISSGGADARDAVLRNPPTTEEHLLFPDTYTEGHDQVPVDLPPVPSAATKVGGSRDAGPLSLLILLNDRIPFPDAFQAVHGWAGGASVTYELDGVPCATSAVRFDSSDDALRFSDAFRRWVGGGGLGTAKRSGVEVTTTSCAGAQSERGIGVLTALSVRRQLIAQVVDGGERHDVAACVVDDALAGLGTDMRALLEADSGEDPRLGPFRDAAQQALETCV